MANKYKIEHNRLECIGCGVCIALSDKFCEMDEEVKSHLKNSTKYEKVWEILKIEEKI